MIGFLCNSVTNSATLTVNTNTTTTPKGGNQNQCPGNSATLTVAWPMAPARSLMPGVSTGDGADLAEHTDNSNLVISAASPADAVTMVKTDQAQYRDQFRLSYRQHQHARRHPRRR